MPAMLWRRLDKPGHDACRLLPNGLEGLAVWQQGSRAAAFRYVVECDADGRTRRVELNGFDGDRAVSIEVLRGDVGWTHNGADVAGLGEAEDIDLGFTPATNTLPILRLRLEVGQSADLVAAWIDPEDWQLKPLPQAYTRLGPDRWRYASRDKSGFTAELTVTSDGLVRDYEGLWAEEAAVGT